MLQSKGSDMTEQLNNVFIGFLLKIISETLFFFFKLLCCKCIRNDKIAIYLTFKISPIKTKLTSFKVLPDSFSLNDYTLLISAILQRASVTYTFSSYSFPLWFITGY